MGAGGSKAVGGAASVATKTVKRALPKAGDAGSASGSAAAASAASASASASAAADAAPASAKHHRTSPSRSLLEPVFEDIEGRKADDAEAASHKFFRPVKPNDGTLARSA